MICVIADWLYVCLRSACVFADMRVTMFDIACLLNGLKDVET